MKLLKFSMLILMIASICECFIVLAYPSPSGTGYSFDLKKNQSQYTDYRTKVNTRRQRYNNVGSNTWLTTPCNDCVILTAPTTEDGAIFPGTTTVAGEEKELSYLADLLGNYRLQVSRYDFTTLTTHHSGFWTMNPLS